MDVSLDRDISAPGSGPLAPPLTPVAPVPLQNHALQLVAARPRSAPQRPTRDGPAIGLHFTRPPRSFAVRTFNDAWPFFLWSTNFTYLVLYRGSVVLWAIVLFLLPFWLGLMLVLAVLAILKTSISSPFSFDQGTLQHIPR